MTKRPMRYFICALAAATLTLGVQQAGHAEQAATPAPNPTPTPVPAPAATPAISEADADAIILDRQLIMQQIEKDSSAIISEFITRVPQQKFIARLESFAKGAKEAEKSFAQKVPGGAAKPELWDEGSKFKAIMTDFVMRTESLLKAAQANDRATINSTMGDAVSGPCKECHDLYKVKK